MNCVFAVGRSSTRPFGLGECEVPDQIASPDFASPDARQTPCSRANNGKCERAKKEHGSVLASHLTAGCRSLTESIRKTGCMGFVVGLSAGHGACSSESQNRQDNEPNYSNQNTFHVPPLVSRHRALDDVSRDRLERT